MLFGMLGINPSGLLTLFDPTGEIVLDLSIATSLPEDGSWFTPGCFCVIDGAFEETGKFTAWSVYQPLLERREASAEVFGHVDFLGNGITLDMSVNSGGGRQGRAMRKAERALEDVRYVFCGEVELDAKGTLDALRKIFQQYEDDPPLVIGLLGNFCKVAMSPSGGSVEYKGA
jgi:DNA polymerase epsilon subunit 2